MTNGNNRKSRRKKKVKLNKKRFTLVATLIVFFCIMAVGAGTVLASVSRVSAFDPKNLDINASTVLYDKDGNPFDRVHGSENRLPVSINKIPKKVQDSFIAIEDVRFYQHHGVSLRDIFRALYVDITHQQKEQGASTITQQLAKTTFLTPDKTVRRKIQEVYLAIEIERKYTKQEVLEMYLNKIYFGHGAYGIQAAAQTYFNKDVGKLTVAEAATLASIPKSPVYFDPVYYPKNNMTRRDLVIDNMAKYGFISKSEANKARDEDVKLHINENKAKTIYNHPFYVDYVITQLRKKGYSDDQIYKGGLKVYTSLDSKIQTAAENVLQDDSNFRGINSNITDSGKQPQAAAVVTDPHTGDLLALVGGRDYLKRMQLNRANVPRPVGSSIKPILDYGPAIENGEAPATPVDDSPLHYSNGGAKDWTPKNDGNEGFAGIVTYRDALAFSRNIPAIEVLQKTKLNQAIKFTNKLGLKSIDEKQGLSNALGTAEITPIQMAGAYGAFANSGIYVEPTAILKVVDKKGKTTEWHQEKHEAMKETTSYLITNMLQTVVTDGTGTNAQIPNWQVAGKTGTTDEGKNLWFTGYTTEYLAVVWIGHDTPKQMGDMAYAGTYAAPIWEKIMEVAHEGKKPTQFKRPGGIVSATICKKSGDLPGPNCPAQDLVTDIFAANTVPTKTCDAHVLLYVDPRTNLLSPPNFPGAVQKLFLRKFDVPNRVGDSVDSEPSPPSTYTDGNEGG